ncbi:helix-turn-helix domain-containing protein [Vineibacter terrae]|nr:helix-turn-helix domain-containing protein [Vineibacter terrae]
MTRKAFNSTMAGIQDAIAYAEGDESRAGRVIRIKPVDVKAMRSATGLNQHEFANVSGIPFNTLVKWEQGQREPTGAARLLPHVIAAEPRKVMRIARTVQSVNPRT